MAKERKGPEAQNALANRIDTAGAMMSYDQACKKVLANRYILAWILKSCIREYHDAALDDIAKRCIEGEPEVSRAPVHADEKPGFIKGMNTESVSMTEGKMTFDVKFRALIPGQAKATDMILNVESQNKFYPGYPIVKRGIYYAGRMISEQYGTVFENAEYEKLRKVASIWICTNPPKNRRNSITRYSMRENNLVGIAREKESNYDLITVVTVCLGGHGERQNEDRYDGLLKMLGVLFSQDVQPDEKKRTLQDEFGIPMTRKLKGGIEGMCNLSQGVYDKGIKDGRKEGVDFATVSYVKTLMEKKGWSIDECMDLLDIPKNKRKSLKEKILGEAVMV